MTCDTSLSLCIGGLISAITALAWTVKQQLQINKLEADIYETDDETL